MPYKSDAQRRYEEREDLKLAGKQNAIPGECGSNKNGIESPWRSEESGGVGSGQQGKETSQKGEVN